ncbi:DUF1990 domain-containing protein [Kitasatospora sp. CMC57]|uniref:DUF1990 domain-containing protein n=1 Tax=Kitasatospora sp. CMC57 TaxID=3231513 RepID=A0AB33K565_9ACTN
MTTTTPRGDTAPRTTFNYPEVGATREPDQLPEGYLYLRHRVLIGHGREALEAAGAALTGWRMHRGTGATVRADAEAAAPGVRLVVGLGLGRLRFEAPAEVVWTVAEPGRIGFAYGTLAGHPEQGEESFIVTMGADRAVWFTVTAFSRPACWYTRLAGPVVPLLQKLYARQLGQVLRRARY